MFGVVHLCARDGFSGKIVGHATMARKNNVVDIKNYTFLHTDYTFHLQGISIFIVSVKNKNKYIIFNFVFPFIKETKLHFRYTD